MNNVKILMPHSAPKPCTSPGCRSLATNGSRCPAHPYPKRRTTTEHLKLYKSKLWIKQRVIFLKSHPYCADCLNAGIKTAANTVDHIKPHRGDTKLFFSQRNWQALCRSCHSRKTAREDGGFGNVRK